MTEINQWFESRFRSSEGETYINGFSINFLNGVRVGVQYADLSHCRNYPMNPPSMVMDASSPDAEVKIIYKNDIVITGEYGGAGMDELFLECVTPAELVNILLWAKHYEQK